MSKALSFACPAGGKSATAAANCSLRKGCIPCIQALPGCWAEGGAVHSKAGLLEVGCSTCLLPALCCPACHLKGRREGRSCVGSQPSSKRESHCAPQPHLAGFYLCSDTYSPAAADTAQRTRHTIHQICWVPSRTV